MITIIIDENQTKDCGLSPTYVYRKLCTEYSDKLSKKYSQNFWGMWCSCDTSARELYSRILDRKPNVKSLILTYKDAEKCFEIFKSFADVWAYQMSIAKTV